MKKAYKRYNMKIYVMALVNIHTRRDEGVNTWNLTLKKGDWALANLRLFGELLTKADTIQL